MKELGAFPRCQYPGFKNEPLDPFVRLAHDLRFAGDFLSGDGRMLLRASEIERAFLKERNRSDLRGYAGDKRALGLIRHAFHEKAYREVADLAQTLVYPDDQTPSQRRIIEIARTRTKP